MKKIISQLFLYCRLLRQWLSVRHIGAARPSASGCRTTLVIPCDPWCVIGSRGDQAMILAVRQQCAPEGLDVLTDSHAHDCACREMGLEPVAEWNVPFDRWMKTNINRYSRVYILGADVTDGVYGWPTAMKLLMFYDCFSRLGIEVHYLGFSWSKTPSPWMRFVLPLLKRGLPLPVRDPVSYRRLENFTRHRPLVQVADAAFLLETNPTKQAQEWIDWCRKQRKDGRTVVAVNVHQMFNDVETKSADWEFAFSRCLEEVARRHGSISWLLVPHDNRPCVSDQEMLERVRRLIPDSVLIDTVMNADEIKTVLGECDALIAGRMHISIAALGQGVPVLGLVYQGKFEGLWQYFNLPDWCMVNPKSFTFTPREVVELVIRFLSELVFLRIKINENLPRVMKLAMRNFK